MIFYSFGGFVVQGYAARPAQQQPVSRLSYSGARPTYLILFWKNWKNFDNNWISMKFRVFLKKQNEKLDGFFCSQKMHFWFFKWCFVNSKKLQNFKICLKISCFFKNKIKILLEKVPAVSSGARSCTVIFCMANN